MLCIFIWPLDRLQYDARRFASFEPFLTLPVTAVFNFDPGFAFLYAATPALVIPAPFEVGRKFFLLRAGILALRAAMPHLVKEERHSSDIRQGGDKNVADPNSFCWNVH
jgi:hypothetical protein